MKRKGFLISSGVTIVIIILLLLTYPQKDKPFKKLSSSNIASVSVQLLPPDETYDLSAKEINEFLSILHDVITYDKDNSYEEYDGQAVVYTINKTDGTTITVNAYNPFIIIDNVGYKTKYGPCEKLNALGNRISRDK